MSKLFDKFLFSYNVQSKSDTPVNLILEAKEFISKYFPDTLFTVFSHKYKPESIEILEPSEYSKRILSELTSIKDSILIEETEFIHINKLYLFPICGSAKRVRYIFIFTKLSSKNKSELLTFLKSMQIFYQIVSKQMIYDSQIKLEKCANLISQITHDFNSALKIPGQKNAHEKQIIQYKDMINNLLFNIRDLDLVLSAVSFNELIHSIIENLNHPDDVRIKINLSKKIEQITIDVELMNKAIVEIVENALTAISSDKGQMTISTQKVAKRSPFIPFDWIELKISDTGPGIPADFLTMIKEPFFTTLKSEGHFGLGLSSAEKIITAHQGSLHIDSTINEGTNVSIYLPEK